jgi:hypothetical protein
VALEQSANATLFGTQTVHATIAIRNFRSIPRPPSEIDLSLTAAYPMLTRGKHCGANRNGAAYRSDIASKMVADAVTCEPVSATKFPAIREINRENCDFEPLDAVSNAKNG